MFLVLEIPIILANLADPPEPGIIPIFISGSDN
jgi:hypothetical protein